MYTVEVLQQGYKTPYTQTFKDWSLACEEYLSKVKESMYVGTVTAIVRLRGRSGTLLFTHSVKNNP